MNTYFSASQSPSNTPNNCGWDRRSLQRDVPWQVFGALDSDSVLTHNAPKVIHTAPYTCAEPTSSDSTVVDGVSKIANTRWMVRLCDSAEPTGWIFFKSNGDIVSSFPGVDQKWEMLDQSNIVARFGSTSVGGKLYRRAQSIEFASEEHCVHLQVSDNRMVVVSADTLNGAHLDQIECTGFTGQMLATWHDLLVWRLRVVETFDVATFYAMLALTIYLVTVWTNTTRGLIPMILSIVALVTPYISEIVMSIQEGSPVKIVLSFLHLSVVGDFLNRVRDPKNNTEWNDDKRANTPYPTIRVMQALSSLVRTPLLLVALLFVTISCAPFESSPVMTIGLSVVGSELGPADSICPSFHISTVWMYAMIVLCLFHAACGSLMLERTTGIRAAVGCVDIASGKAKLAFPNARVYSSVWCIRFLDFFTRFVHIAVAERTLGGFVVGGGFIFCLIDWLVASLLIMRRKSSNNAQNKMHSGFVASSICSGFPYVLTNLSPMLARHRCFQEEAPLTHVQYYAVRTLVWAISMGFMAVQQQSIVFNLNEVATIMVLLSIATGLFLTPLVWLFMRQAEDGDSQKLKTGQMRWFQGRLSSLRSRLSDDDSVECAELEKKIRNVDNRITDIFRSKVRSGPTNSGRTFQSRRQSTHYAVANYINGIENTVKIQQDKQDSC